MYYITMRKVDWRYTGDKIASENLARGYIILKLFLCHLRLREIGESSHHSIISSETFTTNVLAVTLVSTPLFLRLS